MSLRILVAASLAGASALGQAGAAPLAEWLGTWVNPSGNIVSLKVERDAAVPNAANSAVKISGALRCTPVPCAWTATSTVAYAQHGSIDDDTEAIIAEFSMQPASSNRSGVPSGARPKILIVVDHRKGANVRVRAYARSDAVSYGSVAVESLRREGSPGGGASVPIETAAGAPLNAWLGVWEGADGIAAMSIVAASPNAANLPGDILLSARGDCWPIDNCSWRSTSAVLYGFDDGYPEAIIANANFADARMTLLFDGIEEGDPRNKLNFQAFFNYAGADRTDRAIRGALTRRIPGTSLAVASEPDRSDCVEFRTSAVAVARQWGLFGRWRVVEGAAVVVDSGGGSASHRAEMERAAAIIRNYKLNKRCFIGRPGPSLEYWLANASPPAGPLQGEDCTMLDPDDLVASRNGDGFAVVTDGNHYAFQAPSQSEADEVIAVIKYYGFTRSCFVGRPGPSMSYLRK